ncbi:MAG: hypothetical protein ACPGZP_08735 [Panacagrimonas sp.]
MFFLYGARRVVAAMFLVSLATPAAMACSTCKCGDYTITLLGAERPYENRLRLGLDALYRSETEGSGVGERKTTEFRTLFGAAWSPNRTLTLAVQIPWVRKELEDANLAQADADGLGDIDLIARYVLLRNDAGSGNHLAGARLGLRLPTSQEVEHNGELLDIDVQPDAGSTVPNVGGWYSYFRFPWFVSASLTYFSFGDANQDFAPGDAVVASVLTQYALDPVWALQGGLDARWADSNRFSGVENPDSGGTLAMAFVGVAARAFNELVISAGVQLPLIDDLNGEQQEDAVFRSSLAFDF